MGNKNVFATSHSIDKDGVVLWLGTDLNGVPDYKGTRDFRHANVVSSNYGSGYSFQSVYLAPLVGMLMNDNGEVHIKALIQFGQTIVQECPKHDEYIGEYMENAPPGKYSVGQFVYAMSDGYFRRFVVDDITATTTYNREGKLITSLGYTMTRHDIGFDPERDEPCLPEKFLESQVWLLPLNVHKLYGDAMQVEESTFAE